MFASQLDPLISSFLEDEDLKPSTMGINVVDVATGEVLGKSSSEKLFFPASTQKLLTTSAALELLEPTQSFETSLEIDGKIDQEGVLHGNVYIVGGGDPTLASSRFAHTSRFALFHRFREALLQEGIWKIDGEVIVDSSIWNLRNQVGSWEVEDVGNYYGASPYGLNFEDNSYTLTFCTKEEGSEAILINAGDLPEQIELMGKIHSGSIGSGDQAHVIGGEGVFQKYLVGTLPPMCETFSIRGSLPNPAAHLKQCFTSYLLDVGIEVVGNAHAPALRKNIHLETSPTIEEIVLKTNRESVNLYAESLLLKLGQEVLGEGSHSKGLKTLEGYCESLIGNSSFKLADGSGLSRHNLLTPQFLTDLLVHVTKRETFDAFYNSLPLLGATGEEGGTLNIWKMPPALLLGKVRAKGGTSSGTICLAGYIDLKSKRRIAFAVLANHLTIPPNLYRHKLLRFLEQVVYQLDQPVLDPIIDSLSSEFLPPQA